MLNHEEETELRGNNKGDCNFDCGGGHYRGSSLFFPGTEPCIGQ